MCTGGTEHDLVDRGAECVCESSGWLTAVTCCKGVLCVTDLDTAGATVSVYISLTCNGCTYISGRKGYSVIFISRKLHK